MCRSLVVVWCLHNNGVRILLTTFTGNNLIRPNPPQTFFFRFEKRRQGRVVLSHVTWSFHLYLSQYLYLFLSPVSLPPTVLSIWLSTCFKEPFPVHIILPLLRHFLFTECFLYTVFVQLLSKYIPFIPFISEYSNF